MGIMERSHSGLLRSLGKRVYRKVSRVRIPPSPPIFTFCEIVRNCLGAKRLSKLADVSYNSIIKLETGGITNPTIETLQKIAKALEVSVDDLIK